jgi:hypothetical protein
MAGLCKKWDLISKITTEKSVEGMAQAVEHLPSKWEALSLNSQYWKKGEAIQMTMIWLMEI